MLMLMLHANDGQAGHTTAELFMEARLEEPALLHTTEVPQDLPVPSGSCWRNPHLDLSAPATLPHLCE